MRFFKLVLEKRQKRRQTKSMQISQHVKSYTSFDIFLSCIFFFQFQLSVKNCFIRGSVVRYVQLPADECDTQLLQDAARKEAAQNKQR